MSGCYGAVSQPRIFECRIPHRQTAAISVLTLLAAGLGLALLSRRRLSTTP
jgi:hypothetical protein